MRYIPTPASVVNPSWSGRNAVIARHIPKKTSVIDMGCGGKDLLNYIEPSKYLGIDYTDSHADLIMDFNQQFEIDGGWDYLVCSGVLEYLVDVDMFLSTIQGKSKFYLITVWGRFHTLNNPNALTYDQYMSLIDSKFKIIVRNKWKHHVILKCEDLC